LSNARAAAPTIQTKINGKQVRTLSDAKEGNKCAFGVLALRYDLDTVRVDVTRTKSVLQILFLGIGWQVFQPYCENCAGKALHLVTKGLAVHLLFLDVLSFRLLRLHILK